MAVRETFLCFLDTETTGLTPGTDEVIEIAAILTDLKMKEVARFEAKIQSAKEPPPHVAAINGWDKEVWAKEAKPFDDFKAWLRPLIPFGQVAITVGANPSFDRAILSEMYYKPFGSFLPLSYHSVDVCALGTLLRVAGVIQVENVKLTTLAAALGIPHVAHRAMGDVEAAMAIFRQMMGYIERGGNPMLVENAD